MDFIFKPYEGVDNLKFSMTRTAIRNDLNLQYEEFSKTKLSKNTTDDYGFFHAYYDKKNLLEAIEFFPSSHEVLLNEMNIMAQGYGQFMEFLSRSDPEFKKDEDSMISHKYGLSIYAPGSKVNTNAKIESVLVFRKGYLKTE